MVLKHYTINAYSVPSG